MIDTKELRRLAQAATPGPWQFWHGWVAANIDNDGGVVVAERPTPSGGKYQAKVDANFKFIAAANPAAITELLDRLEAAESARRDDYQNWMTALDRNAELLAKLEAAEKELAELRSSMKFRTSLIGRTEAERDELRAKIEQMEQQEPVAEIVSFGGSDLKEMAWKKGKMPALGSKLYALPGAQSAPSVPDGWKEGVEAAARLIDQKAELYAIRFGHDDMGMLSFGTGARAEIKMDYYTSLLELADEVRAMLAAAPETKP